MAHADREQKIRHGQVLKLLRALRFGNGPRRLAAEDALRKMGPQGFEVLLKEMAANESRRRRMPLVMAGTVAANMATLLAVYSLIYLITGQWYPNIVLFSAWGGALGAIIAWYRTRGPLTRGLALFDDVRSIGFFCDCLDTMDADVRSTSRDALVRSTSRDALVRLLPLIGSTDSVVITPEQLNRLIVWVSLERELALAILGALPFIGDENCLDHVRRASLNAEYQEVRDAAKECLPLLEARIQAIRARGTLLQPASAPDAPSETLLRAATAGGETDPALLLRASESREV